MPYYVSDKEEDCSGWATIKEDGEIIGCHTTKADAIKQMIAVSLAENMEPGGERALPKNYRPALSADVPEGRACGNCYFYDESNVQGDKAWCERWDDYVDGAYYCNAWQPDDSSDDEERDAGDPEIIVSDIDGTLSDSGKPITGVIEYLQAESADGKNIFIVSARNKSTMNSTRKWLEDNNVPHSAIYLSDGGDATAFKVSVAEELLTRYQIDKWIENNPDTQAALRKLGIDVSGPSDYRALSTVHESRAISVPQWLRDNTRRGLDWLNEGYAGDGVTDKTISEARQMSRGIVSEDKAARMGPWFARHMTDLQGTDRNTEPPTAGMVAHALWGGWPIDESRKAQAWAEDQVTNSEENGRHMANKIETRRINVTEFDIRDTTEGMSFSGYAAVFNSPSEPLPWSETIRAGAFAKSLKARNNVMMLWSHDTSQPLASTRSKTMQLSEDSKGLLVNADLPNTSLGRDVAELLRAGVVDSMSFGFSVPRNGDVWSEDGMSRELKEVRLHEVSVVAFPAYVKTSATVRSLDALADKTGSDVSMLSAALDALESGLALTRDQAQMLSSVVEQLAPQDEQVQELHTENDVKVKLGVLKEMLDITYKSI